MRKFLALGTAWLMLLLLPATAYAAIGVGVGTGKIEIKENIKSGSIYNLPPITVFNTGTEEAEYGMSVTFNQEQPELKPDASWFSYSPNQFSLQPGKSQIVKPSLHPPLKTRPGKYFAYLEARPAKTAQQGDTAVGVAAATKLSFEVSQSNIFLGIWYRIEALYKVFAPWSYLLTAIVIAAGIYMLVKKYFSFDIRVAKKGTKNKEPKKKAKTKSKPKKKKKESKPAEKVETITITKSRSKPGSKRIEVKTDPESDEDE